MNYKPATILSNFVKDEITDDVSLFGSGHINDTYLLKSSKSENEGYILQKINNQIFKDVDGLMNNIVIVTKHIYNTFNNEMTLDINRRVLHFYPTSGGKYYYKDADGNFWRCCKYIPDTISYDKVNDPGIAFKGGQLFGDFQSRLSTLDPLLLVETIPRFHDLEWRMENFNNAVLYDRAGRLKMVPGEVETAKTRYPDLVKLTTDFKNGKIPMRITHNDTKFNNILFSNDGEALCVVDLDTVMPGTILHDFGDAVRSSCNTADEDEKDTDSVTFNINTFRAFASGYLSKSKAFLIQEEIDYLVLSCRFMTYIMGLRFLTDYLAGDTYYKIKYDEHNLVRCRSQFKLLECMEKAENDMNTIIDSGLISFF
ncbi:MAG: phosphotransferase enzyme family protein [Deltaproteobacteria bacterium]